MAGTLSSIASTPVVGLAEQDFVAPATGIYTVQVKYWVPHVPAGTSAYSDSIVGQSSLQVLVKLNSTTKLTIGGAAGDPSPTQPYVSGSVQISATAGDTIKVIPSSAAAIDNQLNSVKGIINIFAGEGG